MGVLIGPDLFYRDGKVVGDPSKRAKTDTSLKGWKKDLRLAEENAEEPARVLAKVQEIIKSTYKILLSRGRMGCFVWCADIGLRDYFRKRLSLVSSPLETVVVPFPASIVNDPGAERFIRYAPLYSLKAAAGVFGEPDSAHCIGWVKVPITTRLTEKHFVVQVVGRSMQPLIQDGAYCLFRFGVEGSRDGRIVLAQHAGIADPETGGSYTVKRYRSTKRKDAEYEWQHRSISLEPINPDFLPLRMSAEGAEELRIVAEFVAAL